MFDFRYHQIWSRRLNRYLTAKPRVRSQLVFETDQPQGSQSGVALEYERWPSVWRSRLVDFCVAYVRKRPLPMEKPLPFVDVGPGPGIGPIAYRSVELARDTYLAQVAYALWLDMTNRVPWKLEDWSDDELSNILPSYVYFRAFRTSDNTLYYVTGSGKATRNMLSDPRIIHRFLSKEPEQGRSLIGATPSETGQKLSEWFHDYLWHGPAGFASEDFRHEHPLLSDRLRRYDIEPFGHVYITSGCTEASIFFADLMRVVNIPARRVINALESPSGTEERHSGLIFGWEGDTGMGRYLLHTDDLFTMTYFYDPAPAPQGTERGVALWNHVWLDRTAFEVRFSFDSRDDVFGNATWAQKEKYNNIGDWLLSAAAAIKGARGMGRQRTIDSLQLQHGFTPAEAEDCWNHVEASVLSYGDGDMSLGYQRLLDGSDSRHEQWCTRTGKCSLPTGSGGSGWPGYITFDTFPDGTPIVPDTVLSGDEFLAQGISFIGGTFKPSDPDYCSNGTAAAIRHQSYGGIDLNYLTPSERGHASRCNARPISIAFSHPVRKVTLTFFGASTTYTLSAYDDTGNQVGTAQQDAIYQGGIFEVAYTSPVASISRIVFGDTTTDKRALTAITKICFY
jgi:hypothetical protein